MYAVVRTGGKQLRVAPGDAVRVEKLDGAVGDRVELEEVLLVGGEGDARIGMPLVEGAKVVGTITAQGRGEKITVFKMKRRKGSRSKTGHRQFYTEVRVDEIEA
jgi:large subunit ribosomal protein L21